MSFTHPARALFRSLACVCLLASTAAAQSFNYPDFSSVAGLALNGDAAQAGTALRVTPAAGFQIGSAFYDQPVSVANGFDTTFQFQFTGLTSGGADGMAFVIHNDPRMTTALGADGTAMGYGWYTTSPAGTAIANSIAIEMDTWLSGGQSPLSGDTSANEVSVHTGGVGDNSYEETLSIGRTTPAIDMSDTMVHTMRVSYVPGLLEVYLDDLVTPLLSMPYDFLTGGTYLGGGAAGGLNLIGGEFAYIGFTAATGGASENHDVRSWSFDPSGLGQTYCGPAIPNSTGLPGLIAAAGSSSIAVNNLTLTASELPADFGYFLNSQAQGFFNPPNSSGFLCLSGAIGRHNQPGLVQPGPTFSITLDLNSVPTPTAFVAVNPGETWNFQAWYRDSGSNNFTDGLSILFL